MEGNFCLNGSFVLIDGICTKLNTTHLKEIKNDNIMGLEPIKLDLNWLNDFGFIQKGEKFLHHLTDKKWVEVTISNNDVKKIEFMFEDNYTFFDTNIEHVHVLQYLYKQKFNKFLIQKKAQLQ